MANNVFGNPITYQTLEVMPEYEGQTTTRLDGAHVALNMKNAEDKYKNAQEYVRKLKQQWESTTSTICLIYNATGETISFVCEYNWHGHIGSSSYPIEISNGQWGAFLHVQAPGSANGSSGAVVYRGLNYDGVFCDWMAAWSNTKNRLTSYNQAYTEIREEGHYDQHDPWDYISTLLHKSSFNNSDRWNGCLSNVVIESDRRPIFEAIFTIYET